MIYPPVLGFPRVYRPEFYASSGKLIELSGFFSDPSSAIGHDGKDKQYGSFWELHRNSGHLNYYASADSDKFPVIGGLQFSLLRYYDTDYIEYGLRVTKIPFTPGCTSPSKPLPPLPPPPSPLPPPFPRPPFPRPPPPRTCSLHSDCPDIRTWKQDDRFCCGPHGLCVPQPWKPNTNPSSDQMIIWLGCPNLPPPSPPQCYQHSDCPDIRTSNKDDRFCCGTNGACTPQPWKLNTNPNSDRMIIWLGCDNTKSPPPSPAPRRSPPPRRLANPSGSKAPVKETRKRRQKKDRKRKGQY